MPTYEMSMASTLMASKIDSRNHLRRPQVSAEKLNKYLAELSQAEAASSKRNQELLADITKVTKNAQLMKLHTENLKSVRDEYDNYINNIYPPYMHQSGPNTTLGAGSIKDTPIKSEDIFHSTPLHHHKTKKVPPLSSPERVRRNTENISRQHNEIKEDLLIEKPLPAAERCKRNILDLSSQLKESENIPLRSVPVPKGTKLYPQQLSVDLDNEELQTQYHNFIKMKMGSWRKFPSLPDDTDSSNFRANEQLIDLLQDRINKCELHLRDLGSPDVNNKEFERNLDLGFRTSRRALEEIEIECERLKNEYLCKYGKNSNRSEQNRNSMNYSLSDHHFCRNSSLPPQDLNNSRASPKVPTHTHTAFSQLENQILQNRPYTDFISKDPPIHRSLPQQRNSFPVQNSRGASYLDNTTRQSPTPYLDECRRQFSVPTNRVQPSFLDEPSNSPRCNCNHSNNNNSIPTRSHDDSSIRIIPQLLALSSEGQLVLVPMTQPLQSNFANSPPPAPPDIMLTGARSSPIGQSSVVGNKLGFTSLNSSIDIDRKDANDKTAHKTKEDSGRRSLVSPSVEEICDDHAFPTPAEDMHENLVTPSEDIRYYNTLGNVTTTKTQSSKKSIQSDASKTKGANQRQGTQPDKTNTSKNSNASVVSIRNEVEGSREDLGLDTQDSLDLRDKPERACTEEDDRQMKLDNQSPNNMRQTCTEEDDRQMKLDDQSTNNMRQTLSDSTAGKPPKLVSRRSKERLVKKSSTELTSSFRDKNESPSVTSRKVSDHEQKQRLSNRQQSSENVKQRKKSREFMTNSFVTEENDVSSKKTSHHLLIEKQDSQELSDSVVGGSRKSSHQGGGFVENNVDIRGSNASLRSSDDGLSNKSSIDLNETRELSKSVVSRKSSDGSRRRISHTERKLSQDLTNASDSRKSSDGGGSNRPSKQQLSVENQRQVANSFNLENASSKDLSVELNASFDKSVEIEKSVSEEKSRELDNLIEMAAKTEDFDDFDDDDDDDEDDKVFQNGNETVLKVERSSNQLNNSGFSGFSDDDDDASEFHLPSTAKDKSVQMSEAYQDDFSDSANKDGAGKHLNVEHVMSDPDLLSLLIDKLMERLLDVQNEEMLVLSMEVDEEIIYQIMSDLKCGAELDRFDFSQICMVYRHQLESYMAQKERTFIMVGLDSNNDFEGHLRDFIEPCYMHIWDSLFAFLSTVMQEFSFEPRRVAELFAKSLVPDDNSTMITLQASLANILHSITAEDFNREEDVISKSSGHMLPAAPPHPHNDEDQFISMTEDFSQEEEDGSVGDKNSSLQVTSPGANKMSDDEGDLSKTLSVERSIAKGGIDIEPAEVVDGGGGSRGNLKMAAKDEEDGGDSSLGLGSVSLDLSRGGEGGKVGDDEEIKEELPLDEVEDSAADLSDVADDMSNLQKVNLEKLKSFDFGSLTSGKSESEDSGDMSFDSDGIPVPKSPKKILSDIKSPEKVDSPKPEEQGDSKQGTFHREGRRIDVTSPSYRKMRQESIASPVDDIDDDDELDNLLNESLGLSSKNTSQFRKMKVGASLPPQPAYQPSAISSSVVKSNKGRVNSGDNSLQNTSDGLDLSKRSNATSPALSSTSQKVADTTAATKLKLKKPGFWEDSDDDSIGDVVNQMSKTAPNKSNDDDDFDFDFYD